MVKVILKLIGKTIWTIVIAGVCTAMFFGYRYADKVCREYLDAPFSVDLVLDQMEQMEQMTEGVKLPSGKWSYGIDISHHQPVIRWSRLKIFVDENGKTVWRKSRSVKEHSVDYVFMKATEGESFKDWRFRRRWRLASKYGLRRGAYHFFRPGKDASLQVENFISHVGNLSPDDFPPVLDIEKMDGCSVEQLNRRALEWLKAIEKHYGRKPIVYANPHYLNNVISPEITAAYPIWVANYKVSRPSVGGWKFWQFTDRALVKGAGSVDLNVMRGY
jgi:lysozyme